MLRFLDKRMASTTNNNSIGANLVSCGGAGFVRFWNVYTGKLDGEFQAHVDGTLIIEYISSKFFIFYFIIVSSIIMEIDTHNKYLGTGDVNGVVKLWDIEQYCLHSDSTTIEKTLPRL